MEVVDLITCTDVLFLATDLSNLLYWCFTASWAHHVAEWSGPSYFDFNQLARFLVGLDIEPDLCASHQWLGVKQRKWSPRRCLCR